MTTLLLKYWKYVLILALSALSFISIKSCITNANEKQRFESNYNVSVNNLQQAEILHKGELEIYHKDIDSLGNALNIRDKTIETVWQTKYNYKDSAFLVPVYKDSLLLRYDTVRSRVAYSISKPCYDLTLNMYNDSIQENLSFHDQFTGFVHWERPHKFLFIHYGAKQYFMKLYSDCQKDTVKVDKLILIQ